MTAYFDTLAAKKILEQGGIESRQAESVVEAMGIAFKDGVATRTDIDRLESRIDKLDGKIDRVMFSNVGIGAFIAILMIGLRFFSS